MLSVLLHISTKDRCPYDVYLYTTINAICGASSSAVRARISTYQTTQLFEYLSDSHLFASTNLTNQSAGAAMRNMSLDAHRHVVLDGSQSEGATIFEWDVVSNHTGVAAVGIMNARSALGKYSTLFSRIFRFFL